MNEQMKNICKGVCQNECVYCSEIRLSEKPGSFYSSENFKYQIDTESELCSFSQQLVPVQDIPAFLQYCLKKFSGAMTHPFLMKIVADKLRQANEWIQEQTEGSYEILLWDAYRTKLTQQAIFNDYVNELRIRFPSASLLDAKHKALEFVSDPDSIFPHGTGGAVDVTLLKDGLPVWMGSHFDQFIPQSSPNWYHKNAPVLLADKEASVNRELLQRAMLAQGFVNISTEWWHFEWGTKTWSFMTGQKIIFQKIVNPPTIESPASYLRIVPRRQPVKESGVAQVFHCSDDRAQALAGNQPGHYYARASQPTNKFLNDTIASTLCGDCNVETVESGLAACRVALKASVPKGGTLLYDHKTYYETQAIIQNLASVYNWHLISIDMSDSQVIGNIESKAYGNINAVFIDNPRNWWLDTFDIQVLSSAIHTNPGALLICDTSLQPLQPALRLGADIVVCSLSKYPSNGLTMGGVLATKSQSTFSNMKAVVNIEGHVLALEAAYTIQTQWGGLRDRLVSRSAKASEISAMLHAHAAVKKVRVPKSDLLGGIIGGQVSFHLVDEKQGRRMEQVISNNSLQHRGWSRSFALACTFGAEFSTFEHFASNIRHRPACLKEVTGETLIPSDMIRIGIGSDSSKEIITNLRFLLESTK